MNTLPPPSRLAVENAIEALVALLDCIDGDADAEPEIDVGADDFGEPRLETFRERVA